MKNAKTTHSFISQSLGSFFNEVWMDPVGFEDEAKEKRTGCNGQAHYMDQDLPDRGFLKALLKG